MEKLKPCPFCGGNAVYIERKVKIECSNCKATIYGAKIFAISKNYPDYLASLWNRRADSKAVT